MPKCKNCYHCEICKKYAIKSGVPETVLDKALGEEFEHLEGHDCYKDKSLIVELPCKIGDTVYHIAKCRDFSKVLDGTLYDSNGGYGTATGYYCPCELADNCPFDDDSFDCDANKNKPNIFEDTVESVNIDDYEQYLRLDYSGAVSLEDFGKTVFLTREEAEAALEGMKDAD